MTEELPKKGKRVLLFIRKSNLDYGDEKEVFSVNLPTLRILVLLGIGRARARQQIVQQIKKDKIKTIIIPMAHPWDLHFQKYLQIQGVKVIRIIHDSKRHPGDIWPRNKDILKMCDADQIITLSRFTASFLEIHSNKTIVSCHPVLKYGSSSSTLNAQVLINNYDLIIGRQKKYQNSKKVIRWWVKLPASIKQSRNLVVAGNLNMTTRMAVSSEKNVILLDRWLTDAEFGYLVENANRVICIYKEASQSGIVSAAQFAGVPVLVSNVGGLPEQIETFGGGVVASLLSEVDWQAKYIILNELKSLSNNAEFRTTKFMSDILLAIDAVESFNQ